MQRITEQSKSNQLLYLWSMIFLFFATNQFTQYLTSQTADLDQSEQLILSQSFQLGYGPQPPLYTYITNVAFYLSGPSLASLLVIKVLLLSILVGAIIRIGAKINFSPRQQLISVASIAFIPQLIWESQRDLTHSVLATTIAAVTLLQIIRTFENSTKTNYLGLGVLIGAGLISKYNYALILFAFIASTLLTKEYREIILNRRIIITIAVVVFITAPHFFWVFHNIEIASSGTHKIHAGTGTILSGLARATLSAIAFVSPLWIFSLLLFPKRRKKLIEIVTETDTTRFLFCLFGATIAVVVAFVITTGAQEVKDRWYQPLLFYMPILIATIAKTAQSKKSTYYIGVAVTMAILVAIILPARTLLAAHFNKFSRPNMPYSTIYESILASNVKPDFILAETNLQGGNARLFFSSSQVMSGAYRIETKPLSGKGIVVCEKPRCADKKIQDWLMQSYAIDTNLLSFNKIRAPFFYAPKKIMTVYWAELLVPSRNEVAKQN